jgi:hypothetical protein
MRVAGTVPSQDVSAVQADADALVHVEAFDRSSRLSTRYSISTKIPEYMVAGRPILAYGPGEAASLKYVAESQCGIAVGERSGSALNRALVVLSSPTKRREMGRNGGDVAERRHGAAAQQVAFRSAMQEAVDG